MESYELIVHKEVIMELDGLIWILVSFDAEGL